LNSQQNIWWLVSGGTSETGVAVRIRVTPKSSKDAVDGIETTAEGPAFKARVRAVPADGEANNAVQSLLAQWLRVANGRVRLISGAKSRVKSFAVTGDLAELKAILDGKINAMTPPER
jgi:uncharacterized protein